MSYKYKVCTRCDIRKKTSSFDSQVIKGKRYYKPYCSGCKSANYRKRKPEITKRIAEKCRQKYRANQLAMKIEILKHVGQETCKKCGYSDVRALSFHHRDQREKSFEISKGFTHSVGIEALKKEAEKCDVLCMNCHTIEHRGSL